MTRDQPEHVPGIRDYLGQRVTWETLKAIYDLEQARYANGFGKGGNALLDKLGLDTEGKQRVRSIVLKKEIDP
jgi:hypothetical protein